MKKPGRKNSRSALLALAVSCGIAGALCRQCIVEPAPARKIMVSSEFYSATKAQQERDIEQIIENCKKENIKAQKIEPAEAKREVFITPETNAGFLRQYIKSEEKAIKDFFNYAGIKTTGLALNTPQNASAISDGVNLVHDLRIKRTRTYNVLAPEGRARTTISEEAEQFGTYNLRGTLHPENKGFTVTAEKSRTFCALSMPKTARISTPIIEALHSYLRQDTIRNLEQELRRAESAEEAGIALNTWALKEELTAHSAVFDWLRQSAGKLGLSEGDVELEERRTANSRAYDGIGRMSVFVSRIGAGEAIKLYKQDPEKLFAEAELSFNH